MDPLILALGDEHDVVRAYASESLAKLGAQEAVDALTRLLANSSDLAAGNAVKAMARLRGDRAVEPLMELIENRPVSWPRRKALSRPACFGGNRCPAGASEGAGSRPASMT